MNFKNINPIQNYTSIITKSYSCVLSPIEIEKDKESKSKGFNLRKDYLSKNQCSSLLFGLESIKQKCYVCPICNQNRDQKLCKYCYLTCHTKCRLTEPSSSENIIESKNELKPQAFSCYCGLHLKHIPEMKKKVEVIPCNMLILDQILKVKGCWCNSHSITVCCICLVTCHKDCDVVTEAQSSVGQCYCKSVFHTNYNELALTFPLEQYKSKTGVTVWTIQILNILFATKNVFKNMSDLFIETLNHSDRPIDQRFFPLLELFANTFNRKFKTFYFDEELTNMFNYENLIQFMDRTPMDNDKMILVRFRFLFILLFIHLKRDYQEIKTLTSIDFLTVQILERLKYKKRLYTPNLSNESHITKTNMIRHEQLKRIALEVCALMESGMDYLSIEENEDAFEIGLKYLCFLLKRMAFSNHELELLIRSLFFFLEKFYHSLNDEHANIYSFLGGFNTISEICFLITINYNDNVVYDYLEGRSKIPEGFIHWKSESGSLLFKMVLKSCDIVRKHYSLHQKRDSNRKSDEEKTLNEMINKHNKAVQKQIDNTVGIKLSLPANGGLIVEKILIVFNETLKMFSLADNYYFQHINKMTSNDLVDYYSFSAKLNKRTYGNFFYNTRDNKKDSGNPLVEIKKTIEKHLFTLFTGSYSNINLKINNNIYNDLKEFIIIINERFDRLVQLHSQSKMKGDKDKEMPKQGGMQQKIIDDLRSYIINNNKEEFPFMESPMFLSNIDELIDSLILWNLDETLTKVIVFFSHKDYPHLLSLDLLSLVFSFLSLYMMTNNGMKYLLSGKNLTRTSKIFRRYSIRRDNKTIIPKYNRNFDLCMSYSGKTLGFLVTLSKAMKGYGLEIKKHKVLLRFKKNIIEHLEQITQLKDSPSAVNLEVKKHLSQAMMVFYFFSSNYETEIYEDIKLSLINIFCNSTIALNQKNYYVNLYKEEENLSPISSHESSEVMRKSHFSSESGQLLLNVIKPKDNVKINENKYHNMLFQSDDYSLNSNQLNHIDKQLYLYFFRLISANTYFVYIDSFEEKIFKQVFGFNSIKGFSKVFDSGKLPLEDRTVLLVFLRTFVFIEHLDRVDLFKRRSILTNKEYKSMVYNELVSIEGINCSKSIYKKKLTKEEIKHLMSSLELAREIEQVMDIFIKEIKAFPSQLKQESVQSIDEFIQELIYGCKFIADVFHFSKNIVNKLVLKLYYLTKILIEKSNFFIQILYQIKEGSDILLEETIYESEALKKMTKTSFNIYDKSQLYQFISEEIENIFQKTGMNQSASLSNYLDVFDNMSEANFTPFSLIETYDYEYFYEEESEKKVPKEKMEVQLKKIKEKYLEQFINITQTNFYYVISTISNESVRVNYRKKLVDYFHSFLLSYESRSLDKLETLLCVIDKMLFYDGEEIKRIFEKMKYDKFFFPNINSLLHQNIIQTVASSKNIYSFSISIQYISITKLTIQFLQLLGEGFNVYYHDNIFKLQQDMEMMFIKGDDDYDNEVDNAEEDEAKEYNDNTSNDASKKISVNINSDSNNAVLKKANENNTHHNNHDLSPNTFSTINETIYDSIIVNLKRSHYLLDIGQRINIEMPYDKLIVLTTNFIDFLIEYIDSKRELKERIVNAIHFLLFGNSKYESIPLTKVETKGILTEALFSRINTENQTKADYLLRKKVISYVKMKYIQLLIAFLQTGKKEKTVNELIKHNCSPIELFAEILFNFKQMIGLLKELRPKLYTKITKRQTRDSFIKNLIEIYVYDNIFIELIEFPLCMKICILIKTYEEIYNQKTLKTHFNKVFAFFESTKNTKTCVELNQTDLSSEFAIRIYLFLEQIVLKVEIRMGQVNNIETIKAANKKCNEISNLIYKDVFSEENPSVSESNKDEEKNKEEVEESNDVQENDEAQKTKIIFFVRPYLTFRLSKQSMISFEENVDRTNATSKFIDLIAFSDYSLFEMIINAHLIGKSHFKQYFSNLTYRYAEIVNYAFIALHNILLVVHFYRSPNLQPNLYNARDEEKFNELFIDNYVIAIVQLVYLGLVLFNWLYFKFLLCYQHCIMQRFNKNFIFRKKGESQSTNISNRIVQYFQDMSKPTISVLIDKNKDIGYISSFIVAFFDSLVFNREVCIYIYTVVFLSLYLKYASGLYLVFPALFICNIQSTLFGIFQAIKMKFVNMITVLLFIALIVYLYMWITFFYMSFLFDFGEILEWESGMQIRESYCKSSLQCFLFIMTNGVRAGGGVGEILPRVSFHTDPAFFIKRFIYDMCFFIFIIMILFNVFMGLIVDTFAELRDINYHKDNDINNVCFICQLTKDDCLTKNLDYKTHVTKEHNTWNYVYFLIYLHIHNPNDFNRIEGYVWDKLEEQDFGWIPINENAN